MLLRVKQLAANGWTGQFAFEFSPAPVNMTCTIQSRTAFRIFCLWLKHASILLLLKSVFFVFSTQRRGGEAKAIELRRAYPLERSLQVILMITISSLSWVNHYLDRAPYFFSWNAAEISKGELSLEKSCFAYEGSHPARKVQFFLKLFKKTLTPPPLNWIESSVPYKL